MAGSSEGDCGTAVAGRVIDNEVIFLAVVNCLGGIVEIVWTKLEGTMGWQPAAQRVGLSEGYGGCSHQVGNTKQEIDAIFSKHWAKDCFDEAIVCL